MKQKPYSIHFVCRGNTYRSRLAAAYMASILDKRYAVSSSGVNAQLAKARTSERYTKLVAKRHGLTYGLTGTHKQTTEDMLSEADIIVFLHKDVYEEALQKFTFDIRKAIVWDVTDLTTQMRHKYDASKDLTVVEATAEHTFQKIKHLCDGLRTYITAGSWVDVYDKANRHTNLRLPISWVTDRGLWHRGIHVVAQTVDNKFVVGKRAKSMVFAPGMLEITLGGAIDSGEHPLHAAHRETHEELGVAVPESYFRPLFIERSVSYHPHYNKRSRVHLYVYTVRLPLHSDHLRPQPGEVDELRLLTQRQAKHLLNTHRMENFGRLKWGYKLYKKAVAGSIATL